MAAKIRKGDKVVVLSGRQKGVTGEVFEVRPDQDRALVRGINMVKRHQKQTPQQEGGQPHRSAPLLIQGYRMWRFPSSRPERPSTSLGVNSTRSGETFFPR